jgi:hypothetical protein
MIDVINNLKALSMNGQLSVAQAMATILAEKMPVAEMYRACGYKVKCTKAKMLAKVAAHICAGRIAMERAQS